MSEDHPTGSIELDGEYWMFLCRGIVPGEDPGGPVEALQVWFSVPGRAGEWVASPEMAPEDVDLSEGALRELLRECLASRSGEDDASPSPHAS